MTKFLAAVATIAALAGPTQVSACSILSPAPDDPAYLGEIASKFEQSTDVVLARPLSIERLPLIIKIDKPGPSDPYREIVEWRVLFSWKGSIAGRTIKTVRDIQPEYPCVGHLTVSGYEARLLYASGVPPYSQYTSTTVASAERDLLYLQKISQILDQP